MYSKSLARFTQCLSLFFIFLLILSNMAAATPLTNPFLEEIQKERKTLPPVNYVRSRTVDIQHVAIDLRFDWAKDQAYGTTTITLTPFKDLDKFTLDAAAMTINSVKSATGDAYKFQYDVKKPNDNLEIQLDRVYKPGETIVVKIDYRTNYVNKAETDAGILGFGRGLRFIKPTDDEPKKPRQIWSQGETEFNRYWFPGYDTPNDFRTSEVRATVEQPFIVISNGKLMSVTNNPDKTRTFYWKMDVPYSNYLTSIVVGEYAEVKGQYAGIPVSSYVYKDEFQAGAATTKNLPATVQFFSEETGVKYPYAKYAQTMVEDFGGGMENITATTQIKEMIHDERELLDVDSEGLQSHELAHQWFGDYVTCRDWGQIWLNESFATYFQALWDEKFKGEDEFLYSDVRSNQNQYLGTWNQGYRRPIVTKFYADKDAIFDNYAYPRGGAVLHMLRKHLGEDAWRRAINHYLVSNAHKPVSTEDFREAIEEATGQSMDWFFDEWLYKMGHPIFEITQDYDGGKKQLTLNVKQTQQIDPLNEYPQVDFFQTYVDIEIDNKIERVWIEPKAENTFTFSVAAKPKLVNFDYQSTLIKEMKFEKSVDDLIYQMQNDKDVLGRRLAISQLQQKAGFSDKGKITKAILSEVEKDSFWQNRRAALAVIKSMAAPDEDSSEAVKLDDATVQVLLKAAKDPKAPMRSDAISFLGLTRDVKYADLYLAALGDQSYGVMDAAAAALGKTKSPKAYDALIKLTNTPSWRSRIQIAGLGGLAELGDKRVFEIAYKTATDKTLESHLRTSALAVVGATGKGDPRAYPLISEVFKKALAENDFQSLVDSLEAIVKLADPRGQEAFDALKAKFKNSANFLGFIAVQEAAFKKALKDK
jgi:aminopeptidase N